MAESMQMSFAIARQLPFPARWLKSALDAATLSCYITGAEEERTCSTTRPDSDEFKNLL